MDLAEVLRQLPTVDDPRLLNSSELVEDAGVYLYDGDRALVFTTDFFTPLVDDPATYGRIAAANAFSDVYAMGGRPFIALNLMSYPTKQYRIDEMIDILRGGAESAREAGCLILGGHTIDDNEPKYGMAVLGEVDRNKMIRKDGGRPGDALILTKPLGIGILATAYKIDRLSIEDYSPAIDSMTLLNRQASEAAVEAGLTGGTDVTGFGLLGHLYEMCEAASVGAEVEFSNLPFFEGVEAFAEKGILPGGSYANRDLLLPHTELDESLPTHALLMAADAQTSGGLLLAVPPEKREAFEAALNARGQSFWEIGRLVEGKPHMILTR